MLIKKQKQGGEVKIRKQSWHWIYTTPFPLRLIERAGRTCYKSEDKITENSAEKFVRMILKKGHHSVIEHATASVKFITDRGVSHELVRHRLAAYSQESTRYVNYGNKGMEFIQPAWFDDADEEDQDIWLNAMTYAEKAYNQLIKNRRPEEARDVLPNSLKTEVVRTANLRDWMHVFNQRCSKNAHPQMRALMISCREGFRKKIPVIFDEIEE